MSPFEQPDAIQTFSTAIVFMTHDMNDSIDQEMKEIASTHGTRDLWSTAYLPPDKPSPPSIPSPWTFDPIMQSDIASLDYDAKFKRVKDWNKLRRNFDLFILSFFMKHPNYDRYWFIEYDVRYSGDWGLFFDELDASLADLLCTRVGRRPKVKNGWSHWRDFVTPIPESQQVKGFLPISRVSRRFLLAVDQVYRDGWSGHYEAVWPTVAFTQGMLLEDIGGKGSFVPEVRRNRFYSADTFGIWPKYSPNTNYHKRRREQHKNILWHPVK